MRDGTGYIRAWLIDDVLPLWRGTGVDREGFGVWEALDHQGRPLTALPKRLRVQARQSFVFSTAARIFGTDDLDLAARLYRDTLTHGVERSSGNLASLLDRQGGLSLRRMIFMMSLSCSSPMPGCALPGRCLMILPLRFFPL